MFRGEPCTITSRLLMNHDRVYDMDSGIDMGNVIVKLDMAKALHFLEFSYLYFSKDGFCGDVV